MNSTVTSPAPINITRISTTLLRTPPPMPTTAIYSKSDGVAAWQTCRHASERGSVEDIEVPGSHIGMGWNPAVMKVVADQLGSGCANGGLMYSDFGSDPGAHPGA